MKMLDRSIYKRSVRDGKGAEAGVVEQKSGSGPARNLIGLAEGGSGKRVDSAKDVAAASSSLGASTLGAMPVTRGTVPVVSGTVPVVSGPVGGGAGLGLRGTDSAQRTAEQLGTAVPVDAGLDAVGQSSSGAAGVPAAGLASHDGGRAAVKRHGGLAQVTGFRHWSTPTYTRVAIDLGDEVTYEAARVPNPDRIYFDLHGTQLARELVGKSFAVTDDGFLKKIRVAQFSNEMTRVVLDVNDVTEYSAFLLPNPYRLIIDIHGGSKVQVVAGRELLAQPGQVGAGTAAAEVPAPRVAATVKATPAKPVPNTVSTRSASTTEIASLSAQPGKVEATSVPTSQPISAVVKDAGGGRGDGAEFGVWL